MEEEKTEEAKDSTMVDQKIQGKNSGDIDVPSKDGLDISVDDYEQEQEML